MSIYRELNGTHYGMEFLVGRKRPIPFLDHYHRADNADFAESIRVQHAFKDGHPETVKTFAPIMSRIVAHELGDRLTHVVPVLGSTDLQADPTSGTYQLATAIAKTLGIPVDTTSFFQTGPRDSLHGGRRTRAQREEIVRAVLRQRGRIALRQYLVVDDVFTTGATMTVYAELMEAAGASLAAGAALFRYENNLQLLNPELFPREAMRG
jgi:predicted amidophosphoribosyltransferase